MPEDTTIPAPGVYPGMPDADYRAIPAVSKSDLDKWALGRDIDPRVALMGTVFHAAILERETAIDRIVVCESRRNSNAWKECVEASADRWVLTQGEYKGIVGMVGSVKDHPELSALRKMAMDRRDKCELVVIWRDGQTGVMCKAKIDQITDRATYDWKSTGQDREGFGKSIGAFGYDMQGAHYAEARASIDGPKPFRFACVNKRRDWGHPCWWFELSEEWLVSGRRTRQMLLNLFRRYQPDHPACQGDSDETQ